MHKGEFKAFLMSSARVPPMANVMLERSYLQSDGNVFAFSICLYGTTKQMGVLLCHLHRARRVNSFAGRNHMLYIRVQVWPHVAVLQYVRRPAKDCGLMANPFLETRCRCPVEPDDMVVGIDLCAVPMVEKGPAICDHRAAPKA